MLARARESIDRVLGSESYDHFFGEVVGNRSLFVPDRDGSRLALFSGDPRKKVLASHARSAQRITSHAANPTGPAPGARPVANANDFAKLIRRHHDNGHTVRIPEAGILFPDLAPFLRALEASLLVEVSAVLFWSSAGLEAPVHHDNNDILMIQLFGEKRWFISSAAPSLPNPWKMVGEPAPQLHQPLELDLAPGDLLYMPRGTPHTVRSTSESLHLSIGFTPFTVRDAIAATLDHLSDFNRPMRVGATPRADDMGRGLHADRIEEAVREGVDALGSACQAPGFINEAIEHRNSRFVGALPGLPGNGSSAAVDAETLVRRTDFAFSQIVAGEQTIDFSQPGGHILVHRGAEESLRFLAAEEEFRVGDLPGDVGDDVRVALVRRFIGSGYLEPVTR